MDEASALMQQAKDGDAESLRRLLLLVQRPLRLTAAIFLPTLSEVDATMGALTTAVVANLDQAPVEDPLPWLRRVLRDLINAQMTATTNREDDVVRSMLRHAGRERLATVPVDADPVSALQGRLRWMSKGATDLLVLRFTNGLPIERLAAQRALSVADLCDALQTACRQLDWTGDASGGGVDAEFYRVIDGIVCTTDNPEQLSDESRQQLTLDPGLSLRAVRAARLHLIAAAWHAPEVPVTVPVLKKRAPPPPPPPPAAALPSAAAPATATRRHSAPALPRPTGSRGASTPTRRQLALRGSEGQRATSLDDDAPPQRSGLIATLIGGALVIGAVALLFLRGGATTISPTPASATAASANDPTTISTAPVTPPAGVTQPVEGPTTTPPSVVTPAPAQPAASDKPLFSPEFTTSPLAAWSTRRLVSTYNGPVMRVRRSGDLSERDIGFDASGMLDTATLTQFTSRSSAHVVCWYDQSGNNHHMRQPANDKQPRIMVDGALVLENSRPVVAFDRTRFEHLSTPAGIAFGSMYALITVRSYGDGAQGLMGSPSNHGGSVDAYYPIVDRDRKGECEWWIGQQSGFNIIRAPIPRDRLVLWNAASDGKKRPRIALRLDGKEVGAISCTSDALTPLGPTTLGCLYWEHRLADPFGGSMGECFIVPSGLTLPQRDAIKTDLKRYWKTP